MIARIAEEWRELVRRIRIDGPIPTTLEVRHDDMFGPVVLDVTVKLDDVATGRPSTFVVQYPLNWRPDVRVLRDIVAKVWLHELDERFTVDGERPFNPHSADSSARTARRL